jgi:carboxypeptidase Taq
MSQLQELKTVLAQISRLQEVGQLLNWDQQTYMPTGGAEGRSEHLSTISRITHELSTSTSFGKLIDAAEKEVTVLDSDHVNSQLVRMVRYDYELSTKLPTDFVAEMVKTTSMAEHVWIEARKENDYAKFVPWLQKNVDIAKKCVDYYGFDDLPYDALLNLYEPKMKTRDVRVLFDQVRPVVVDLVQKIEQHQDMVDSSCLLRSFSEAKQEQFGKEVVATFGYDFNRGRLDRTTHPFASSFGKNDCRITTRYDEHLLQMSLMGTMHEAGHAMYEQNVGDDLVGTTLAGGCSNSLHESQSRMWENLVGRSRNFWRFFFPKFREMFPESLSDVEPDQIYRAFNKVCPSLIRVEADEVTYNLHIILRFELEQDLLEGKLSVADAPEAWNAKMSEYLGLIPPDNSQGVLQDIHWAMGGMGYFPTYSLGNFLSCQLYETAIEANPAVPSQIAEGDFSGLFNWLKANIWVDGRRRFPQEQIVKATGRPLETGPYLKYLKTKFADVYGFNPN